MFAPGDEEHVADIARPYRQVGGRIVFVQLLAPREVLLGRVLEQGRLEHRKITDAVTLERLLDRYDDFTAVADPESVTIDLAATSAEDAAGQILDHLAESR